MIDPGIVSPFFDRSLFAAVTYTHVFYMSREIGTGLNQLKPPSAGPDAAGTYEQSVDVLNLNLEWRFGGAPSAKAPQGEAAAEAAGEAG